MSSVKKSETKTESEEDEEEAPPQVILSVKKVLSVENVLRMLRKIEISKEEEVPSM